MIILVGASAIYLTALQAVINAPREAFKTCLKSSYEQAAAQKVEGDGFEAFVKTACSGQLNSFKSAVVGFDMSNKMSRKDASADADLMIADFVSSSADHYRYLSKSDPAKAGQQQKAVATPAAAPVSPQPPK